MSEEFIPRNPLEFALQNAVNDPASRPLFLRELLDAQVLIIPAGDMPPIVDGVVPCNKNISLAQVMSGGRSCVPFFTSDARVPAGTQYLVLAAKDLFEMTRGAYLVMNPGWAYGKEFFPDEVARLLDGTAFKPREQYVAQKAEKVLIGQPKDYPHELVAALTRLYSGEPAVKRAWVAFYHNPSRDREGGLLIALDVASAEDMERVSGESGVVIESMTQKHKFVDLIRYDNSGVAGYFTNQKPFYGERISRSLWQRLTGR